jgi:DNA-directed RNA polymerase specialized sigma24 family protein
MNDEMYRKLVNHARRVLPPDPALEPCDLVQQAYIKAKPFLDRGRSESEQLMYLFTAITNLGRDGHRRYRHHPSVPFADWTPHPTEQIEDVTLDRVALAPYFEAARSNPQLLAVLLFGLGFDYRDTAAAMGVSLGSVRQRLHRWRQAHEGGMA